MSDMNHPCSIGFVQDGTINLVWEVTCSKFYYNDPFAVCSIDASSYLSKSKTQ